MNWFKRLVRIELVLIYLVIIAGSVVRMTGSGMGCPDWPKCFGYLIPPTEKAQLEWHEGRNFKKGQIIIWDEALVVANKNFTTGSHFEQANWNPYTKHNYAIFNPFHTWVEYINRLTGALSGIPMLLLFFISLLHLKKNWRLPVLSFGGLFFLGFEAWLGKKVVDGNLIPGSITIHMLGALIIVAILCLLLAQKTKQSIGPANKAPIFRNLLILSILLTLFQIIIGTQIREQVDILNEEGVTRSLWMSQLDWQFYFHRSFSIVVTALSFWLWRDNIKNKRGINEMGIIFSLIILEIIFGIILAYFSLPKFAQPVHLLLGTLIFGFQFYALTRYYLSPKTREQAITNA